MQTSGAKTWPAHEKESAEYSATENSLQWGNQ
jgi:hypothetical protein